MDAMLLVGMAFAAVALLVLMAYRHRGGGSGGDVGGWSGSDCNADGGGCDGGGDGGGGD
jgi:hypothetical protein